MRVGQISFVSFSSQVLASLVGFAATVAITQVFGSEVYGNYVLIIAVVIWLKILATMGIKSAVSKRVSEGKDVEEYVAAGLLLLCVVLVVLSGLVLLMRSYVNAYVGQRATLFILALTWTASSLAFAQGVLQGRHLVHYATALKPLDRTVRSIVHIVAVVTGVGLVGFLFGYGIGGVIAALAGFAVIRDLDIATPKWYHVSKIIKFGRFSWLGKFSSRTFTSMDTIVLGAFVSAGLIGVYEASWNLASMLAIFGTVIAQTMFPEMSTLASDGNQQAVGNLLEDALTYAGLFLIPGLVGSIVIGDLVLLVYGTEFEAGHYILVLLVLSRLLYVYADQILTALNGLDRPDLSFQANGTFVLINIGLNIVLVWQIGWFGAAIATASSSLVTICLSYWMVQRLLPDVSFPIDEVVRQFVAAVVMGGVVYIIRLKIGDTLWTGVALALVGAAVYILLLSALSAQFRSTVADNLPA